MTNPNENSPYRRELHEHVGECPTCQQGDPCSWARSVIAHFENTRRNEAAIEARRVGYNDSLDSCGECDECTSGIRCRELPPISE